MPATGASVHLKIVLEGQWFSVDGIDEFVDGFARQAVALLVARLVRGLTTHGRTYATISPPGPPYYVGEGFHRKVSTCVGTTRFALCCAILRSTSKYLFNPNRPRPTEWGP